MLSALGPLLLTVVTDPSVESSLASVFGGLVTSIMNHSGANPQMKQLATELGGKVPEIISAVVANTPVGPKK